MGSLTFSAAIIYFFSYIFWKFNDRWRSDDFAQQPQAFCIPIQAASLQIIIRKL